MPKVPEKDKINELKEFMRLTWEVVRRNPDYRIDHVRFLQNYGLTPEDVKEKVNPDGSRIIPYHPARGRTFYIDFEKGRPVPTGDVDPDSERCNLPFMLKKWGFACDPDDSIPQGPSWHNSFIDKTWRKRAKGGEPIAWPLDIVETDLSNLPGVIEVNKYPEIKFSDNPKFPWQKPDNFDLSVTINLQAPFKLIRYAFELLIQVCQADLGIERKIEWNYIKKCLAIYDLYNEGYSLKDIADNLDLTHYKADEAMKEDLDTYLEDWGVPQVKRCLADAKKWIEQGSII